MDESAPRQLGFPQLCSDRRYHRATMLAFEHATGLRAGEYWIEARAGGAPSWGDNTKVSRKAYRFGARHMGWAIHGGRCAGFPGESNQVLRNKLARTARKQAEEFPQAAHYLLFGEDCGVEVVRL